MPLVQPISVERPREPFHINIAGTFPPATASLPLLARADAFQQNHNLARTKLGNAQVLQDSRWQASAWVQKTKLGEFGQHLTRFSVHVIVLSAQQRMARRHQNATFTGNKRDKCQCIACIVYRLAEKPPVKIRRCRNTCYKSLQEPQARRLDVCAASILGILVSMSKSRPHAMIEQRRGARDSSGWPGRHRARQVCKGFLVRRKQSECSLSQHLARKCLGGGFKCARDERPQIDIPW